MSDDGGSSNDLCVNCGICCDGALFNHAQIWPEEEAGAREFGFTIEEIGGTRYFLLPCGNLCGTACQIYNLRPTTCRTFKCVTLKALEADEIDRAEADRRVEAGKAAIDNVRKRLLPGERFLDLRRRFGEDPAPAPDYQLEMVRWQMLMDRYFRQPHQRVVEPNSASQEPIAPPAVSPEPCTGTRTTRARGGLRPASRRSQSTLSSPPV